MKRAMMMVLLAMLSACSTTATGSAGSNDSSCSASVPASCPTAAPSYQSDVAPLLGTYCNSCHGAGGSESDKALDSYAGVARLLTDVEGEVAGCSMPPSGSAAPTDAERATILAWIVCGGADN
jgi:cytochrome c5